MDDSRKQEMDYSRDVIDDLVALSYCRHGKRQNAGCNACPFGKSRIYGYECDMSGQLVDSIQGILLQFSGDKARHFLSVIDKCTFCEECCCDECPYSEESIERHREIFYQHVYDFMKEEGLYNEDGSVSGKGAGIRVSDTLALLKTTGLTKDSWMEERGGLLL